MNIVKSFSYREEKRDIIEDVEKIAKREGRSLSELIVELLADYQKKHKAGNPQHLITSWADDPNMRAYPAFGADIKKWVTWMRDVAKNLSPREAEEMLKDIQRIGGVIGEYARRIEQYGPNADCRGL